jgi:hypothetical protein
LESFSIRNNGQLTVNIRASSINNEDKTIIASESDLDSLNLIDDRMGYGNLGQSDRLLSHFQGGYLLQDQAVPAEVERSCYSLKATGKILSDKYPEILQPYRLIEVITPNPEHQGKYLIQAVSHKLTVAAYEQSFTLLGISSI